MKVLVTGAAGYLGSVLCPLLTKAGHEVVGLDNFRYWQEIKEDMKFGDIHSVPDMYEATEDVEMVIALAAVVGDEASEQDKGATIAINYEANKLLVEMCELNGVKRIVFASTCSVYGDVGSITSEDTLNTNPLSLYAKTRLLAEKVLKRSSIPTEIIRFGTLFGWSERMRFDLVANYMTAKAVDDGEIVVHGGDQSRPMVHVLDAAQFMLGAIENTFVSRDIQNAVTNNYTVKGIAEVVADVVGDVEIKYEVGGDVRDYTVSPTSLYGYGPKMTLEDGVKEMKDKMKTLKKPYTDDQYYNVRAWV